jgi:hypothetical protein
MALALIWRGKETYCVANVYSTKFSSGVERLSAFIEPGI